MRQSDEPRSARRAASAAVLAACMWAASLFWPAPAAAVDISWKAISSPGSAISLLPNSHATAGAWVGRYHGLKKGNESDQILVATMRVYMEYCDCDKPGKPTQWLVAEGLRKIFAARGHGDTAIKERCRHSSNASEKASLSAYKAAIDNNRPVVLTFCYDAAAANNLATAKRRMSKCFSMVGIGYMKYGDKYFLICHDGCSSADSAGPAAADRVSPQALGINTEGKPWGQRGTALYKWNGAYKNLVMVFVGG